MIYYTFRYTSWKKLTNFSVHGACTSVYGLLEKTMTTKICNHCLQEKDENEFNWRYKTLGVRNKACKGCQHSFNKTYYEGDAKDIHLQKVKERSESAREVAREFVYQYLLSHPCSQCGETDPRVLEFHHVGNKDTEITRLVSGGWSVKRIQEEINKCKVLCANCHRRLTMTERGWFKGRK